jgi:hypothetical protein
LEFVPVAGQTFRDIGSDSCDPGGTTPTDTEAPTVIGTVPSADAKGVDPALPYVTATFSEDMLVSSINGKTFKLYKKGSSTSLPLRLATTMLRTRLHSTRQTTYRVGSPTRRL